MGVVVMGFVGFDCFFYVVALWPVVVVMGFVGFFFFSVVVVVVVAGSEL